MLSSKYICSQLYRILGINDKLSVSAYVNTLNFIDKILKRFDGTITTPFIIIALRYINYIAHSVKNDCITFEIEKYLFAVALMLAHKTYSDHCYSNKFFSKVFDLNLTDLNFIELELLVLLDFQLTVSLEEYIFWIDNLTSK